MITDWWECLLTLRVLGMLSRVLKRFGLIGVTPIHQTLAVTRDR